MRTRNRLRSAYAAGATGLAALAAATVAPGGAHAASMVSVVVPPLPPHAIYGDTAQQVNNSGQVLGWDEESSIFDLLNTNTPPHALVWNGSTRTDLTLPFTHGSYGENIDASGHVAGESLDLDGNHAEQWVGTKGTRIASGPAKTIAGNDAGQVLVDGVVNGVNTVGVVTKGVLTIVADHATGTAINNKGQVTGWTDDNVGFVWNGNSVSLLTPPAGADTVAPAGINDNGEVVGTYYGPTTAGSGVATWTNGKPTVIPRLFSGSSDLPQANTLLGTFSPSPHRPLRFLNDSGTVVGESVDNDGWEHGFSWQGGHLTDLGRIIPTDINDEGQIVGYRLPDYAHGDTRATSAVVVTGGTVLDLGAAAGYPQSDALWINDHNQVAGLVMTSPNSQPHAALWTIKP